MPSRFPYEDIVKELRASILEGRLDAGERLPSENELAERYATSRPTVRRAMGFARSFGGSGLLMCNAFAFRATLPRDIKAAQDPIGVDNDKWLVEAAGRSSTT